MHWRAQCHVKWPKGSRRFQNPAGIEPKSPHSLQLTSTTQPLVHVNFPKKPVCDSSYYLKSFATCNCFFACTIVEEVIVGSWLQNQLPRSWRHTQAFPSLLQWLQAAKGSQCLTLEKCAMDYKLISTKVCSQNASKWKQYLKAM